MTLHAFPEFCWEMDRSSLLIHRGIVARLTDAAQDPPAPRWRQMARLRSRPFAALVAELEARGWSLADLAAESGYAVATVGGCLRDAVNGTGTTGAAYRRERLLGLVDSILEEEVPDYAEEEPATIEEAVRQREPLEDAMTYRDALAAFQATPWFQSRPRAIQRAALGHPTFLTYRHRPSGALCRIESYGENVNGTCTEVLVEWFDPHAPTLMPRARLFPTGRKEFVPLADLEAVES